MLVRTFVDSLVSVKQCALPDAVPAIRRSVSQLLATHGVPAKRAAEIELAVTEACANVVRHAYPDRRGDIACDARMLGRRLVVCVSDWGQPFDAPTSDPGLGVGAAVITTLAQAVHRTTHQGGEKRVEMTFDLAAD